jgi:hypothetical protein
VVLEEDQHGMLLYLNSIEHAAGAMEMSAVAGKNLANIAMGWIERRDEKAINSRRKPRDVCT